jgi:hypothetical protein
MRWGEFTRDCPELAEIAREWIADKHILLLGTLRPDGSPRISAVECDIVGEDLCSGMIWQSAKALDLEREPRMTVHSLPPGQHNPDGDLKLYGRALPVTDPGRRRAYGDTLYARIQWRPDEPYHLFAFDFDAVGLVRFTGDEREVRVWRPGAGLRTRRLPAP